jgi:CRP/FNR family transcriptional regulator, anaerobic regulatory protein
MSKKNRPLEYGNGKEFEHQRVRLTGAAANSSITRVASYLLAVSAKNMREGMDPNLIDEPTGPVASYLQIAADQLAHILSLFRTLDLIQPEGLNHLSLKDLGSIRKIAEASIGQASGRSSGGRSETGLWAKAQANG